MKVQKRSCILAFVLILTMLGSILLPGQMTMQAWAEEDEFVPEEYNPVDWSQVDWNSFSRNVHTIWWEAKVREGTTGVQVGTGKKVRIKNGGLCIVTNRANNRRSKSTILYNDVRVKVPDTSLYYIKDLCSTEKEGDYKKLTKLWFVNVDHRFKSKTKFLVWASLDKQRVNVFYSESKGQNRDWVLIRKMKCSSGAVESPTKTGFNKDIGFKARVYRYSNPTFSATVQYFNEFGGSGFHKWSGGGKTGVYGLHTISHSCIRLGTADAIWFYDNVPVHSRVVIY